MSDYAYDVFLSYCRAGTVPEWVHNHFHPMLLRCLTDELEHPPRVFLDVEKIQTSDHWPSRLVEAHRHSRVLVAVWTPSYFGSRWCLAEWRTMLERQRILGLAAPGNPCSLVYPVVLKDGARFPPEARRTQCRDMKRWNNSVRAFDQVPEYVEFENQVAAAASDLVTLLTVVPDWRPDWPVLDDREPPAPDPPDLPRL